MKSINVKFAKTREDAIIPKQVLGSAGLDLYPCFNEDEMIIPAHTTKLVSSGVKVMMPEGYFMLLAERGSTGSKGIKRSAGVIDNDFRGEIFMAVTNSNNWDISIRKNMDNCVDNEKTHYYPYKKALFQGIILPQYEVISTEISEEELSKAVTARGAGMLGSSGK